MLMLGASTTGIFCAWAASCALCTSDSRIDIAAHKDAGRAAETLAGIAADHRSARDVERGGERKIRAAERRLDQRLPHSAAGSRDRDPHRSEEHTSELQSRENLVCRLLLEKKKK